MELIKWQNTAPSFKNLVDEFFNRDTFGHFGGRSMGSATPAVNVKEDENNFNIEVAAPGFKKDAFKIEVDAENVLVISAEVKNETEEKTEGRYTRREFMYSSFKRRFTLPENVDSVKIDAEYVNGVLFVKLPKKEVAKVQSARLINVR